MSRPTGPGSYASVLRRDGVAVAFAAATIARLSYAMVGLSLILAIEHATGSFAVAGTAVGLYGLVSLSMPLKSRLIDRRGVAAVLPWLTAGFSGCLVALAVLASAGTAGPAWFVSLAVGTGLFAPPIGPTMRAIWAAATPEPDARRRAYSLDGVVEDLLYAVGPLLVGGALTMTSKAMVVVLPAALNLVGTSGLARCRRARRPVEPTEPPNSTEPTHALSTAGPTDTANTGRRLGPLTRPGFGILLFILLGLGIGGGTVEVSVIARLETTDRSSSIGWLLAALAVGSVVGGLLWGRFAHRHRPRAHLAVLAAVSAVLGVMLAPTTSLWLVTALLFGAGLTGAPILVTAFLSADQLVDGAEQREASTWISTLNNVGIALGAAMAGTLIDRQGPGTAFAAGAAAHALTLLVIITLANTLTPRTSTSASASPAPDGFRERR